VLTLRESGDLRVTKSEVSDLALLSGLISEHIAIVPLFPSQIRGGLT
jgi:hypothetical protein